MKQLIIIFFSCLCFSVSVKAQEDPDKKLALGITFSSFGDIALTGGLDEMGGSSKNIDQFFAIGIIFLYPVNSWLDFESGVDYKHFRVVVEPGVGANLPSHTENMSILDIPIVLRANFLKYCFANGGLLINTGSLGPINSQSGIGGKLCIGLKYKFMQKITAFVNPYITVNAIVPFSSYKNFQRLLEAGFRFGITWDL
jgi:hypothetical protein